MSSENDTSEFELNKLADTYLRHYAQNGRRLLGMAGGSAEGLREP